MNLTFEEGKLFYDLYAALLSFANRKLKVSSEQFSDSRQYTSTPPEARVAVRDALFSHRKLIDEFVAENPTKLSSDELEIVGTWKHAVVGKFSSSKFDEPSRRSRDPSRLVRLVNKFERLVAGHPECPVPPAHRRGGGLEKWDMRFS